MDSVAVLKIIKALAEGVDPTTGEILAEDHFLRDSNTVEALLVAHSLLKNSPPEEVLDQVIEIHESDTQNNAKSDLARHIRRPTNDGKRWTEPMDSELVAMFRQGITLNEMALKLKRFPGGVAGRVKQLKLHLELFPADMTGEVVEQPTGRPNKSGKRWTPDLDSEFVTMVGTGASIIELAQHFERGVLGIRERLIKHGLIEEFMRKVAEGTVDVGGDTALVANELEFCELEESKLARSCEYCGKPIPEMRLEAVPTATSCVGCQEASENGTLDKEEIQYCPRCEEKGRGTFELVWRYVNRTDLPTKHFLGCNNYPSCKYTDGLKK